MTEDPTQPNVGYKKPPAKHQFKPGQSGNPKGRPPKTERSFLPRQLDLDILSITEEKTRIRTAKGIIEVSLIEAVIRRLIQRALEGHGPSLRHVHKLHAEALLSHAKRNKLRNSFVEMVEEEEILNPVRSENKRFQQKFLNDLRKKTRRL